MNKHTQKATNTHIKQQTYIQINEYTNKSRNKQINVRKYLDIWILILKFAMSYRKHDVSEG